MKIYVSINGPRNGVGTREMPLRSIAEAAKIAKAGDEVIVAPGVYREYVDPINGGEGEDRRISYISEVPMGATITGSEAVTDWEKVEGDVWKTVVPNGIFGAYNPYEVVVEGDWLFNRDHTAHAGNVYVDGRSIFEAFSDESLKAGDVYEPAWDHEWSCRKWRAEVGSDFTTIYVNLKGESPLDHSMEISVRRNVLFPSKTGVNYITVSGFRLCNAATQWAPPTAFQDGLIGPHWSKGWIIEDCEVFESKCCGISLGKCLHPSNDNKWTRGKLKDGTQNERDVILLAQHCGWSKDSVGSHIVRRCHIHDCDQTGIVGHLGGVFCLIEDNHIHHTNTKKELAGAETAGIKIHAAIDTVIRRNRIHDCNMGIWMDWQAQGTRISQNLLYNNQGPRVGEGPMGMGMDVFVEVSHGPTLIDNNVMLSDMSFRDAAQGLALVHNIIGGPIQRMNAGPRYTPYHFAHETDVKGFMTFHYGDDRYYNNVFIARPLNPGYAAMAAAPQQPGMPAQTVNLETGLHIYDDQPTPEEYFDNLLNPKTPRPNYLTAMPMYVGSNVYFNGARPYANEKDAFVDAEHEIYARIVEVDGEPVLETNLYEYLPRGKHPFISTEMLGEAFEPEQKFENPDGSPIFINQDYLGDHRGVSPMAGPFEDDPKGRKLW